MEQVNPQSFTADDLHYGETAGLHRDPITGAPHSHPIGTGVGAVVGAGVGSIAAAAAIGAGLSGPAAPLGAVVGAVVATLAGAAAGHAVAERYEGSEHDLYWRQNYETRPYVEPGTSYEHYAPAYRYGWESRRRHEGRSFDEVESNLSQNWDNYRGGSNLSWDKARAAARDAWERTHSGTSDSSRGGGAAAVPERLTPADFVHSETDASFVAPSAPSPMAGRDVASDMSGNPDLADPAITRVEPPLDIDNPDVAPGRTRNSMRTAADRTGL